MGNPPRSYWTSLPYGITQCYLPPDTGERAPPNPNQKGIIVVDLTWSCSCIELPPQMSCASSLNAHFSVKSRTSVDDLNRSVRRTRGESPNTLFCKILTSTRRCFVHKPREHSVFLINGKLLYGTISVLITIRIVSVFF